MHSASTRKPPAYRPDIRTTSTTSAVATGNPAARTVPQPLPEQHSPEDAGDGPDRGAEEETEREPGAGHDEKARGGDGARVRVDVAGPGAKALANLGHQGKAEGDASQGDDIVLDHGRILTHKRPLGGEFAGLEGLSGQSVHVRRPLIRRESSADSAT